MTVGFNVDEDSAVLLMETEATRSVYADSPTVTTAILAKKLRMRRKKWQDYSQSSKQGLLLVKKYRS